MEKTKSDIRKDELKEHNKTSSNLQYSSQGSLINRYMDLLRIANEQEKELDAK